MKPDDRVMIRSKWSKFHGRMGTVTKPQGVYHCIVLLDGFEHGMLFHNSELVLR